MQNQTILVENTLSILVIGTFNMHVEWTLYSEQWNITQLFLRTVCFICCLYINLIYKYAP